MMNNDKLITIYHKAIADIIAEGKAAGFVMGTRSVGRAAARTRKGSRRDILRVEVVTAAPPFRAVSLLRLMDMGVDILDIVVACNDIFAPRVDRHRHLEAVSLR